MLQYPKSPYPIESAALHTPIQEFHETLKEYAEKAGGVLTQGSGGSLHYGHHIKDPRGIYVNAFVQDATTFIHKPNLAVVTATSHRNNGHSATYERLAVYAEPQTEEGVVTLAAVEEHRKKSIGELGAHATETIDVGFIPDEDFLSHYFQRVASLASIAFIDTLTRCEL
jgi:hypothetical protein